MFVYTDHLIQRIHLKKKNLKVFLALRQADKPKNLICNFFDFKSLLNLLEEGKVNAQMMQNMKRVKRIKQVKIPYRMVIQKQPNLWALLSRKENRFKQTFGKNFANLLIKLKL